MDLATMHPEIAAVLEKMPRLDDLSDATLAFRRTTFPPPNPTPLSDEVLRTDHEINEHGVFVRVHRPKNATGPLPCIYWMHGGGLILGNRFQDDVRFDKWCQEIGMVGVSVDYRLAPETPYPGPLEDCHDGLVWTRDHAEELGIDPTRIGIGGASAGGGLAAGLALLARDRGSVPIACQLLVYPMIDDRQITPSSQAELPIWTPQANTYGWKSYLGDRAKTDAVEPYAAAARATDLRGLPPTYLLVGGLDGFVDEDIDYATRLNRAGVPTDLRLYPGMPHGFDSFAPGANIVRKIRADQDAWLQRTLHP